MLVILSEINCLDNLNKIGVYPDIFYTDYEKFKTETFLFDNADVIILFAGNSRFVKRLVFEQIIMLTKRAEDETDKGVRNLFVITDIKLGTLKKYYKYTYDITETYLTENFKEKEQVDIWGMFKTPPKQTKVILSDYDIGNSSDARNRFENRRTTSEDDYLDLIVTPDIRSIKRQKALK